jgi:hypothetical protein
VDRGARTFIHANTHSIIGIFCTICSFAVLLCMYTFVMLICNLNLEVDDMRKTGLHVRTLIAVYQKMVDSVMLSMHTVFVFSSVF